MQGNGEQEPNRPNQYEHHGYVRFLHGCILPGCNKISATSHPATSRKFWRQQDAVESRKTLKFPLTGHSRLVFRLWGKFDRRGTTIAEALAAPRLPAWVETLTWCLRCSATPPLGKTCNWN